ncbi:PAS domain S-box protein [Aeromicrobium sp. A1-2]|uniref:sensor domain-containing protein n=1 Tax=Aeromicrobium sp. A1-2 TaxID=2107713 RepID=UPI000E4F8797|nr:EAL domain-containing protein [Aeromicrobium sp. A1-2]AXT85406.1 PAS domain S-box protein [Aeromicrobium sp. A1-2]
MVFAIPDDDSAMLRQIIEATPNAMVMVDDRGRITMVNSQTEILFGHARSDLVVMHVERLIPDRFRGRHGSYRTEFFKHPDTRAMGAGRDLFGLHRSGHEFPIEIGLNPVRIGEDTQVLASIIDITERKRAEERLHQVVEAAPNAMIMINAAGGIVLVNSQTERSFDYSRAELLTMNIEDLIPERFRPRHDGYRDGFFQRPDRREMGTGRDLFGRRKDGSEIPIEIGLNPIQIMDEQHVLASVIDITERLAVQAIEIAKRADLLRRSILDSLPFSIIASEPDGTIVTANPAAERLLGFDRDELIGSPMAALRAATSQTPSVLAPRSDQVDEREVDYNRKDGTTIPVNEASARIASEDGDVSGMLSVAYDITQRREAEAFIRHMAHFDFLTDLPNRTKLFERLDADLEAAARTGRSLAVALLDLDHFKRVNDSLGHHVGDELLIKMAERLRSQVRADDMVARLGGDEFVLVFTSVDGQDQLEQRITEMLAAVPEPFVCNGHELFVTASIGVALFPDAGRDATTLLKHADTAMYHAKSTARNSFQWFEGSMLDETNDKLEMAAALRHALDRGEISVSYQMQVCLTTGDIVGVEALARWRTADGVDVPPDRFIPVAEDNGLIIRLGEWVLCRACLDVVTMSAQLGIPLKVAVNVSPRQFHDKGWLEVLQRALAESGLPADRLELEITEGIFMEDPRGVVDVLHTVRALGVAIVVDDFGTGFSSLAYLTRFPIDKIKIDRSFIANVAVDAADAAIVDTIIVMAHTLGMSVVGEGVETEPQEAYLRGRGCDEVQGYRYSRAVPAGELAEAASGFKFA